MNFWEENHQKEFEYQKLMLLKTFLPRVDLNLVEWAKIQTKYRKTISIQPF